MPKHKVLIAGGDAICNVTPAASDSEKTIGWNEVTCSACMNAKPLTPYVPEQLAFDMDDD